MDAFIDKAHRYCLGFEEESATAYLSIPVGSNLAHYEEYYALSDAEYSGLLADSVRPGCSRSSAGTASTTTD